MSNKKFKIAVKESKKSESAESEFIQDFRSYMDTMDGEPYSEDDLIGWGWEWVSEKEEYPNGTKTCVTTYTMTGNGARYKLVVHWNSFMGTIVGYELTQEPTNESKKNEADAPFKVGDFVTYDAASDGKEDFINEYVAAEIAEINDDGSLVLWIYDLDDGGNDVKDADPQCCTKLDHYAGKVDANHYYMDGPYKAYKGGWEILITKKDLNPRVYEFIGTMDDLGEVLDVDAYYGGENFVYDQELEGAVEQQGWAADEMDYADMSGDVAKAVRDSDESKKSEGLPQKRLGSKRRYSSRADLINKMKQLGAVEVTTSKQFNDIKNSQWLHTAGYALDTNGNLVAQSYYGDKDGKWYYTSTRNFDSDYLPESKQHESKSDGERAVDDYDTLIDGLKELGFEPSSNVRNGKIYPYRTRFTATKDGIKYGFTLNEDRTGEYLESIEVVGGSIYTGDPKDKDARVFKSVGEVLDALKQVDGKKSESTENTTESERISFIKDLANKLGIDNLEEDRASAHMSGWRYFNNDDEGGDGVVLSLKAYPWARDDQSATIDVWLETGSGVIGDCWLSFDFGGDYKNRINADTILTTLKTQLHILWSQREGVAKKSESLSLKQKELKDMARYGEAEDITTISDAEAKELRKKGIETVGVSRGTYGMNGALLRDKDGNKYVITARSSNLFYFV